MADSLVCPLCVTYSRHGQVDTKGPDKVARTEVAEVAVIDFVTDEVLYHHVLKPKFPVTNTRYCVSGLTMEMIENATHSLADFHDWCLKNVSGHTIIVGHGIANDLSQLGLFHPAVVDTGRIFPHPFLPKNASSLAELVTRLRLPAIRQNSVGTHSALEDARSAKAAMEARLRGGEHRWWIGVRRKSGSPSNAPQSREKSRRSSRLHRTPGWPSHGSDVSGASESG